MKRIRFRDQTLKNVKSLPGKLRKLRKTSLDELRVRCSQVVAAFTERRGWTKRAKTLTDKQLRALLDPEQFAGSTLLDHFRKRTTPRFFAGFDDPHSTITEFRRHWKDSELEIKKHADQIVEGRFDLLGFQGLCFGSPIDWQLEPVAGKRAPLVHWSKLNYLEPKRFGDKKIVWELNRHQYFVTLGQAYWFTDGEHYAETFVAHITSWIEQNPPKLGINWASSLEVAFRSISWLWALHFFLQSSALTPEIFSSITKTLYQNASHLETYLSTYFSPNTHLTGEALGLFYLGTMLPEFKEASRWRKTGLRILIDQLELHVQPDGVYFEQSSYYHRYTTDFYLHLQILLGQSGEAVPQSLEKNLQLLLNHLMYITRPDGTTPLFGDDDGGRLMPLERRAANDFRATLGVGAALFSRADYKYVSNGAFAETLWLLGPTGLNSVERVKVEPPAQQSVAFPSGGYYVMRDGWAKDANYLLVDCGRHGTANCGHAHADALSFELAANGHTLIVDPGTFTYTGSSVLRDWFRSSAAHNTVTVDNRSSSVPAGAFSWKTIAETTCSNWITQEQFDYIVASHNGFYTLPDPVSHERAIFFVKNNYWVVRDNLASQGSHELTARFHLDASAAQVYGKDNVVRVIKGCGGGSLLQIAAFCPHAQWVQEAGWVSNCYGKREEAPVFAFSVVATGSRELVTFLLPESFGAIAKPEVRQIESLGGSAFEIGFNNMHDVLMFRAGPTGSGGHRVETVRLAADFEVVWARFARADRHSLEEFVLINGHRLEFEGRTLLQSTKQIKYLAARRDGDLFKIETDEGLLRICLPATDFESHFADLNL